MGIFKRKSTAVEPAMAAQTRASQKLVPAGGKPVVNGYREGDRVRVTVPYDAIGAFPGLWMYEPGEMGTIIVTMRPGGEVLAMEGICEVVMDDGLYVLAAAGYFEKASGSAEVTAPGNGDPKFGIRLVQGSSDTLGADLHAFHAGNRVRLASDFCGIALNGNARVAMACDDPSKGNEPVDYPAGSHGTVIQRDPLIGKGSGASPSGMDRYLVAMEDRRMSLIVDGMDIERIYGRAKVIKNAQGEIYWEQIFRNGDQVRLRESFTNNGQLYEARREGEVFFGDLTTPALLECWATGYYPVTLSDGQPNLGRVAIKVPAHSLNLATERRVSLPAERLPLNEPGTRNESGANGD